MFIHLASVLCFLFWGGEASQLNTESFRSDYQFNAQTNEWYKLHVIPANWHDARLRCQLEGAVLASPLNHLIKKQMMTMMMMPDQSSLFTGIHATFSKGDYFSVEGVPLSKIRHEWAPLEPDNKQDSESCIAMYKNGRIKDVDCAVVHQYICYRKHDENATLNECGTIDNEYKLAPETGKCYKFHRNPRTWSRAFMTCAAEGGYLAIINSQEEANVLSNIFSPIPKKEIRVILGQELAFIGFHDWGEHGNWLTIHGQTLKEAGYSTWGKRYAEPNNVTSAGTNWVGEYCGSIYRNAELSDLWCDYVISFICEMDPPESQDNNINYVQNY